MSDNGGFLENSVALFVITVMIATKKTPDVN